MRAFSRAQLQLSGPLRCGRASVLQPLAFLGIRRLPRMFASAATASRPLATATTATATVTRAGAGLRVSHRHAGHAGFFMANAVLSRDPLSQGPIGGGSKLPRPRGTRPTPKNTKKTPRTLPCVPGAQTDRPGRQTHVPRGAKCRCSAQTAIEISSRLTALRTAPASLTTR